MFTQVPVYLGEERIGTAEIIDDKLITIDIRREALVKNVQDLTELNQIRGFRLDVDYLGIPPQEVTNGKL
jgi:hypothetical protein